MRLFLALRGDSPYSCDADTLTIQSHPAFGPLLSIGLFVGRWI
jgi:hypothetical protein